MSQNNNFTPIDDENLENRKVVETVVTPEPIDENNSQTTFSNSHIPESIEQNTENTSNLYANQSNINNNQGNFLGLVFKYIMIFLLVFGVLFIILALYNNIFKRTPTKISLEYWGLWEEEVIYQPLIQSYQQKNPNISIKYIKQSPINYQKKLITRIKDGSGPDMFKFHNTWTKSISEILTPIPNDIMSQSIFEKTFYKIAQADLKIGSQYYGIPLTIDGLLLAYNKDLFDQLGFNSPPQTLDELITYARALTVPDPSGEILTSGISLGTADNIEHFSDILGWMYLQNGATLSDLSSKEAIDVLKLYRSFAEQPNNTWSETMQNNIAAFTQGKVGMIIVPSWQLLTIKSINPELNIKTSELPILPGEKDPFSIASYWVEGVSRGSNNQKEAWKFLEFLSQKENMIKLYEQEAKSRLFGEPYSRVDLKDLLLQNEYIRPIGLQASYFQTIPMISRTFDDGINDGINKYLKDAINDTIKGVSYQEASNTLNKGVNKILKDFSIEN